jgi:hypothetical protein
MCFRLRVAILDRARCGPPPGGQDGAPKSQALAQRFLLLSDDEQTSEN